MKCVKNIVDKKIRKVSDDEASMLVKSGWVYCPRKDWKAEVRSTAKPAEKLEKSPEKREKKGPVEKGQSKYKMKQKDK